MKLVTLALLGLIGTAKASGESYITRLVPAAFLRDDEQMLISMARVGDVDAIQAMVDEGRCTLVLKDTEVYVVVKGKICSRSALKAQLQRLGCLNRLFQTCPLQPQPQLRRRVRRRQKKR
jgi:hypothetical protein